MRFAQLGAVASLAGLSQAFLLPPPTTASTADDTLPFEDNIGKDGLVMEVNCPGCPVGITDLQGNVHFADVDSVLKLNLSVAHGGEDQLVLNGLPIYPIDPLSEAFTTPLTADQMAKNADNTWSYVSTPTLGYSLSVKHPVQMNEEQLDLVAIHIEIVEVANKFLDGIPSVELKLLQTPSGKLMLGSAEITSPKSEVSEPKDSVQECTTLACKWRAIIADKLSKLKGCGNKARPAKHEGPKHHGHHGRPHRRPHHGAHPFRHHRHRHSLSRFIRNVTVHVLIPILIGIVVGITASLAGMIVGNIVIFVYRLLFRRDRAQYMKVEQVEVIVEESDDETKAFLEPQGPPPTYTEADEKTVE